MPNANAGGVDQARAGPELKRRKLKAQYNCGRKRYDWFTRLLFKPLGGGYQLDPPPQGGGSSALKRSLQCTRAGVGDGKG